MVRDARIVKGFGPGKGPKLSPRGGFAFKVGEVSFSGALGKARAGGSASAAGDGCHGKGRWNGMRRT
jgi:hypothetical protein